MSVYYKLELLKESPTNPLVFKVKEFAKTHTKEEIEKEYIELGGYKEFCEKYDFHYPTIRELFKILGIKPRYHNHKTFKHATGPNRQTAKRLAATEELLNIRGEEAVRLVLIEMGRTDALAELGCNKNAYWELLKRFNLPTKVGDRRDVLTNTKTDEELISLFNKYDGNFLEMSIAEKLERPWVLQHRLRLLGFHSKTGPKEGFEPYNKGKTKETHPSIAKQVKTQMERSPWEPSSLEYIFLNLLIDLGIEDIDHQYNVHGKALVDFYLPFRNLIIEVDGCYFHCCSLCHPTFSEGRDEKIAMDRERESYLKSEGFNLLRYWEHDIYKTEFSEKLAEDLGKFLRSPVVGDS